MAYAERHTVSVTTAADGSATVYIGPVTGAIRWVKYTKTNFADTVDFAITTEETGQSVWGEDNVTATKEVYPVTAADLSTGVASTITEVPIYAANERIKFAITNGGNATTGAFALVVG